MIVDVFYDHFLAKKWEQFAPVNLKAYTLMFYEMIAKYANVIPETVNSMLVYMSQKNGLYNYQFLDGIGHALTEMSKRTTFNSKMELAVNSLEEHYELFEKEFDRFFPKLEQYVQNFLK